MRDGSIKIGPGRGGSGQDVDDGHDLRLPGVHVLLMEDRHEPLSERVERILRLPDLVDHEAVALTEAGVVREAGGRPFTFLRELGDDGAVLLLVQRRRVEVDRDCPGGLLV